MYLRIVRARTQSGQVDEFAKRWQEFAGANVKSMPGFRHAHLAADRDTNRITAVLLFDTQPDPARVEQAMQQMAERARDLLAGPPEAENYEVLVEV